MNKLSLLIAALYLISNVGVYTPQYSEVKYEEIELPVVGVSTLNRAVQNAKVEALPVVDLTEPYRLKREQQAKEEAELSERSISETEVPQKEFVPCECDCAYRMWNTWDESLKSYTIEMCNKYEVPVETIASMIWLESRGDVNARSYYGGYCNYGLMQINGVNYEWLRERVALSSVEELQDPYKNIECGVVLLRDHLNYTGNVYDAVLRYQVGIGSYEKYKRNGWGNEYTDRVMREGERMFVKNIV